MSVVSWFKLHSYFFLKPREHNNVFTHPHFGKVMIQCLETSCGMLQFEVDSDLILMPKIISVIHKVIEIILTMSKAKKNI